mgnify:FL=1|jgi:hypothetical protein
MIKLFFEAVDGGWTREAKTIEEAKQIFVDHIGSDGIRGLGYAVSADGVVRCMVEGCTYADLGITD